MHFIQKKGNVSFYSQTRLITLTKQVMVITGLLNIAYTVFGKIQVNHVTRPAESSIPVCFRHDH